MKSVKICFLLISVIIGVNLIGCNSKSTVQAKKKAPKKSGIRTAKVVLANIEKKLSTTGNIVAENTVVFKATVEGPISFYPWREGDKISKDQKVIEISRPFYAREVQMAESALQVARAKLADLIAGTRPEEIAQARETVLKKEEAAKFASADFERIEKLVKTGALPPEDAEKAKVFFASCQADLKSARERLKMLRVGATRTEIAIQKSLVKEAEAKLNLAKAKHSECFLISPFNGIVSQAHVRVGDLATPRSPLLKIYDPDSIVARFAVPEVDSGKIAQGKLVEIKIDAIPGKDFKGVVTRVYPKIDQKSRTRMIEARVENSSELIPGMFARVTLRVQKNNVLVIPDEAVVSTVRGEKIAYAVEDEKAIKKVLQIGLEQDNQVEVLEGLREGDTVVTYGNRSLKDGELVKILSEDENVKGE